jgi:hypothetical protein
MGQAHSAHASFHLYRLSVIATWPESEYKQAALAAAEAAFQGELAFERSSHTCQHLVGPAGSRQ